MKVVHNHVMMWILLLGLFVTLGTPLVAQSINIEGDVWAPYVMDPAGGSKGFMVDIAELVFSRAGYKVNFTAVPWTRALADTQNGTNDGIAGIYFTQASEKGFVVPSEELGISINNFFVKKSSAWTYSGIKTLDAMVLGVIADYDYGELNPYIDKLKTGKSEKLQIANGNEALQQNLKMLISDRITVVVEDVSVAIYAARKMGIADQIKTAGSIAPANKVGIAFSAKNPKAAEYAKVLSDGIQKLRKSGELKIILEKYYAKDWK